MFKVGIIGGSGLDDPNILEGCKEIDIVTPYGKPTSTLKTGKIKGIDVVIIARHGRKHTIPPTQVNYKANIYALKDQGCTHILATTAVGSLLDEIARVHLVVLDQFIDFTRRRDVSFHESFIEGNAAHTPMSEPFNLELRANIIKNCEKLKFNFHPKGTVITIEGPRFSTKAESYMFRAWGADVINMSIATEAILANELKIPYAAVAMSTDYDCWKENEETVSWEIILDVFKQNASNVTKLLVAVIENLKQDSQYIKNKIRTIPHWPKKGIMFRDITSLLKDKNGYNHMIEMLAERYKEMHIDIVAGIESRGFITGSVLAHRLGVGFVPIRKPGKLPGETISEEYELEYGRDKIEIHKDAINPGDKVLLIDDLIATGGTALAAAKLVQKLGGKIVECSFIIDLPDIGGKKKLENAGYKVFNLVEFEGE